MLHNICHRLLYDKEKLMLLRFGQPVLEPPFQLALQIVLPAVIRKPLIQRLIKCSALQLHRTQLRNKISHLLLRQIRHINELLQY
ncbi:hypothetical protein D3C78_1375540 [compost metagenome]